jgi:hypothetical protein
MTSPGVVLVPGASWCIPAVEGHVRQVFRSFGLLGVLLIEMGTGSVPTSPGEGHERQGFRPVGLLGVLLISPRGGRAGDGPRRRREVVTATGGQDGRP